MGHVGGLIRVLYKRKATPNYVERARKAFRFVKPEWQLPAFANGPKLQALLQLGISIALHFF